jgi:hypothetical protein
MIDCAGTAMVVRELATSALLKIHDLAPDHIRIDDSITRFTAHTTRAPRTPADRYHRNLNVFVGVVQSFQKLPFFQPLAPTQSEPPFLIAQIAVLAIFIVLGFLSLKRFHPPAGAAS